MVRWCHGAVSSDLQAQHLLPAVFNMRFCLSCHAQQAAPLRPIAQRSDSGPAIFFQPAQLRNVQRRCFAESVVSQATSEQHVAVPPEDSLEPTSTVSSSIGAPNVEYAGWTADGGSAGREARTAGDISLRVGTKPDNASDAIGVVYGLHRKLPKQVWSSSSM